MPSIGRLIRQERERAGVTLQALADAIGVSKSQLSLIESGKRSVRESGLRAIQRTLKLRDNRLLDAWRWEHTPREVRRELTELAGRERDSRALAEKLRTIARQKRTGKRGQAVLDELLKSGELRRWVEERAGNVEGPLPPGREIPIINKVAAGYPREFTDLDYPAAIADDYIACPDVNDPNAFACRVVGDSMEPDYREGEIVVFSPAMPTESGADCFVRLDRDDETTFKRIYLEDGGRTIRLQPINRAYPPQIVRREDVGGMYAAVYVMRRVRE